MIKATLHLLFHVAFCVYTVRRGVWSPPFIVSFLPKISGRNQDFSKGFVCGDITFQSAWRERVLGRNLNFQISALGEVRILTISTFVGISDMKISNFSPSMMEKGSNSNLPILWHHSLMFANVNKNPWKSGLWGRSHFWKWRGRNFEYNQYPFNNL